MMRKKLKNDDQAVLGFFLAFILSATMLVFLFAIAIPFLIDFTTDMYAASDAIFEDSIDNLESISDEEVRDRIIDGIEEMQGATEENIEYLGFFYKYSWVFVVLITMFTIFMLARQVVETKNIGVV